MSRLAYLQGKPQQFKIGNLDLDLTPLSMSDLELFSVDENATAEKQLETSKKLISKVLKQAVPDATDEEIGKISLEHLTDLMSAITKLHKLPEGDSRISRIKDVIAQRKTQLAQKE